MRIYRGRDRPDLEIATVIGRSTSWKRYGRILRALKDVTL